MITLIGSAHVLDISDRIEEEIIARGPDVVAVELDKVRYGALKSQEEDRMKNVPLLYRLMHKVQKRLAEKFDVDIGAEMLTAVDTAEKIGAGVAFIDMPSQNFLSRLMDQMSLKEKAALFLGGIAGLFVSKKRVEKEIEKYESGEMNTDGVMSVQMPVVKRILIDERNEFMSKNLRELDKKVDSIVAVVGDGHIPGMKKLLRDKDLEIIRLKDIRGETSDEKRQDREKISEAGNTEVSFSYEYDMDE